MVRQRIDRVCIVGCRFETGLISFLCEMNVLVNVWALGFLYFESQGKETAPYIVLITFETSDPWQDR